MTFDELISEIDSGALNTNLTDALRDLIDALNRRAQDGGTAKGELALKLRFAAANNGRVELKAEASVKSPGPRKAEETRWIGARGELLASDPRQAALPLRVAGRRPEPVGGE